MTKKECERTKNVNEFSCDDIASARARAREKSKNQKTIQTETELGVCSVYVGDLVSVGAPTKKKNSQNACETSFDE